MAHHLQILDRLKAHLVLLHPNVPTGWCTPMEIATEEADTHLRKSSTWLWFFYEVE